MRIDWRTDRNAPRCRVIDLDTGAQMLYMAMADEETGEYEQYVREEGKFVVIPGKGVLTSKGKARLKIEAPYTVEAR